MTVIVPTAYGTLAIAHYSAYIVGFSNDIYSFRFTVQDFFGLSLYIYCWYTLLAERDKIPSGPSKQIKTHQRIQCGLQFRVIYSVL